MCKSFQFFFQSFETQKLQTVAKQKERLEVAAKRVAELNDSFSKETEKKQAERLEAMEEKKNSQIKALQEKLQDHVSALYKAGKI